MTEAAAHTEPSGNQPGASRTLTILIVLYALALLDRQVLSLLVGPIKASLEISDFEIGLLQGFAFSVFYSVAALPLGWLVDRLPRRPIIFVGVVAWSVAATACGLARSFGQLLTARMGVGVGEAALAPAAYSMLADLYRPERLAFAMSVLLVGSSIGNGFALGFGGMVVDFAEKGSVFSIPFLGDLESWQFVLVATGLPGLILAPLILLVPEPVRRGNRSRDQSVQFADTLRFMAERRGFFVSHFVGFGLLSITGWALISWLPVYMVREFGWTIGQVSVPLALLIGGGGTLGLLVSGRLVDMLFTRGVLDAHLRIYVVVAAFMSVLGVAAFQIADPWLFLLFIAPIVSTMSFAATAGTALQIVTPNEMRGQVSAMFLLVISGVGLGVGPMLVGAITDFIFHDEMRLGDSLALIYGTLAPAAALILWRGLHPMRLAVQSASSWHADI